MNLFQALLLGIVQGITEFFPVSSSAHLKLTRYFLEIPEQGAEWAYFDLACHAGTWLALAYFLRKEISEVLFDLRKIGRFSLAIAPLIPAYFLLKPLRTMLSSPSYTGYFLLMTAGILFLACRKKQPVLADGPNDQNRTNVLFVGCMQALALLPGLSRSGLTIAAGRFSGWSWIESARFSFLLAIPTILGGEILESFKIKDVQIPFLFCAVGFAASFVVGLFTVRFVFWIYERQTIKPFAWYCIAVGLFMIAVFRG